MQKENTTDMTTGRYQPSIWDGSFVVFQGSLSNCLLWKERKTQLTNGGAQALEE